MNKQTRILIGLSIILAVLISLSAAVYFNSIDLDCSRCSIEFKNTEVYGVILDQPIIIGTNLTELNNSCAVMWSRTQGYYYGY